TTADGAPLAVEVTVEYAGGAGNLKIEVPYGSIEVIPLRPEQRASLTVRPGPGFRIGAGETGKLVQTSPGEEVKGGLIGLIVDARGRPLRLPADDAARRAQLLAWGQALRAYASRETFGLEPGAEAMPVPEAPAEPVRAFRTGRLLTGTLAAPTGEEEQPPP